MMPQTPMQFVSARDIGVLVAAIIADPEPHLGATIDLAGDQLTGDEIAAELSRATGTPVTYRRLGDAVGEVTDDALAAVSALVERGPLRGDADIPALRALHPGLQTYRDWLDERTVGAGSASARA
jgi:uncharacterized protein YbjT (DUF2867 family)